MIEGLKESIFLGCFIIFNLLLILLLLKIFEGRRKNYTGKDKCIYCKGNRCRACMWSGVKQTYQYYEEYKRGLN
jgi:hypothetical protein